MRRTCKACDVEYRHEPATARAETGEFFIACSVQCLTTLLADAVFARVGEGE